MGAGRTRPTGTSVPWRRAGRSNPRGAPSRRDGYRGRMAGYVSLAVVTGVLVGLGRPSLALGCAALPFAPTLLRRTQLAPWTAVGVMLAGQAVGVLTFVAPVAGEAGRRDDLVAYGVVTGAAVALALVASITVRRPVTVVTWVDRAVVALAALAILQAVVGVLEGNHVSFLVGDIGRLAITIAAFTVTRWTIRSERDVRWVLVAIVVALTAQQFREVVAIATLLVDGTVSRLSSIFWQHSLAVVAAATALALSSRRARWMAAGAFSAAITAASAFRTFVALVAAQGLVFLALRPQRVARAAVVGTLALAPILAVTISSYAPAQSATATIVDTLVERSSSGIEEDVSASERSLEVREITGTVLGPNGASVVGHGAGATWQLPSDASVWARELYEGTGGEVHNVHSSTAAMLLRSGILGVGAWWFFVLASTVSAVRCLAAGRGANPVHLAAPVIVLAYLAASELFFFVVGDFPFAIALGLVATSLNIVGTGTAADPRVGDASRSPGTPRSAH